MLPSTCSIRLVAVCVIPIPVVHCFEFAPVDCNGRLSKQAQLSIQHHKLAAHRPDCGTIVPSKIGDCLEVRCQSAGLVLPSGSSDPVENAEQNLFAIDGDIVVRARDVPQLDRIDVILFASVDPFCKDADRGGRNVTSSLSPG